MSDKKNQMRKTNFKMNANANLLKPEKSSYEVYISSITKSRDYRNKTPKVPTGSTNVHIGEQNEQNEYLTEFKHKYGPKTTVNLSRKIQNKSDLKNSFQLSYGPSQNHF